MKRFADLSITEGVLVQLLWEQIDHDDRVWEVEVVVEGGEVICHRAKSLEEIEKAYNDYIFGVARWNIYSGLNCVGTIILVHGNEEDLFSDYSTSLEEIMAPVNTFINGGQ